MSRQKSISLILRYGPQKAFEILSSRSDRPHENDIEAIFLHCSTLHRWCATRHPFCAFPESDIIATNISIFRI